MNYNINDIFSPRSFPENTYISRKINGHETIDVKFQKALSMKGNLIFVSGASKSGKTVLCRRVIGDEHSVNLSGNQLASKNDFWTHIAEQIPLSDSVTISNESQTAVNSEYAEKLGVGITATNLGFSHKNSQDTVSGTQVTVAKARTERQIIKYLIENNKVLVIDDFHYAPDEVKLYIARTLKTELFNGLKAVIISLPYKSDEAIRYNPDLIDRTTSIDIPSWQLTELKAIATKGFNLLNKNIPDLMLDKIALESIASPQLMQENCFNLAYYLQESSNIPDNAAVKYIFQETASNYHGYYAEIIDNIKKGPSQGQGRRTEYMLTGKQNTADIYELILLALKADPPVIKIKVDELKVRIKNLLAESVDCPSTLTITSTISKITKIVQKMLPNMETLAYKEKYLYILDPFLLFYLRWHEES